MKMLEHQKWVIQQVSNDKELFKNELYKSLAWLEEKEIEALVEWLKSNYWSTNSEEIIAVFRIYLIEQTDFYFYQKPEE